MMVFVFDQALAAFRFHAEVWLSYAQYELGQQPPRVAEARAILKEAIDLIPNVSFLRIALAELEEVHGGADAARDLLRTSFEKLPSALTFSVYQRFIRRTDGMNAARKLFSETFSLRADKTLGTEVRTFISSFFRIHSHQYTFFFCRYTWLMHN